MIRGLILCVLLCVVACSPATHQTRMDRLASQVKLMSDGSERNRPGVRRNVALRLNNLGWLFFTQGEYRQAEPLLKRALAIREKALGPDHIDVALSLNTLGALYHAQGQDTLAEPLHKRALAIREKALGPDHPEVAQSLNNLAALYRATEQDTEAEVLEQRAEEPQEAAVKAPVQQPQHGAKPQPVAKPGQRAGKGPLPEPQNVGKLRQRTVKDRLQELHSVYQLGLINEEEFEAKRKELLDSL